VTGGEADHSSPSSAEVKNGGAFILGVLWWVCAREIFTSAIKELASSLALQFVRPVASVVMSLHQLQWLEDGVSCTKEDIGCHRMTAFPRQLQHVTESYVDAIPRQLRN
jgi:hypothetical protein